jgi:proteasome accessory factor C
VEDPVSAAYDLARARRLLLLLPACARALRRNEGLPLSKAVVLTGARSERQLREDIASLDALWTDPAAGEEPLELYVENDEVFLVYATLLGGDAPAFSLAEAAVLRAALERIEADGGKTVEALVHKLRRAVSEPLRDDAERLARGLDVAPPAGPWAGALQEAIDKRVETTIYYAAVADTAAARRTVEPRALFHRSGRWYLAAWNVEKGDEHLFRLDRLERVELGTRVFGEHKGPELKRYARRRLFFDSGAEREVILRFRGTAARLSRERHADSSTENPDGSVTVAMRLTPGNYLTGVVLGHGGEATVEGPPDVAQVMRERIVELQELYRNRRESAS